MVIFTEGDFYGPGSYLPVKPFKHVGIYCSGTSDNVIEVGFLDGSVAKFTLGNYSSRSWNTENIRYIKVVSGLVRPLVDETTFGTLSELKSMIFGSFPANFTSEVNPLTQNALMRDLEVIAPTRETAPLTAPLLDLSVAAAGSGNGTFLASTTYNGSLAYIQMGISEDALGTSPHDSYIQILDSAGNIVAMIKGAVNSPFFGKIQLQSIGQYTYKYLNGDSVAHWFFLSAYVVIP